MWIVVVDKEKCDGKGECVDVCPSGVLKITDGKADPFNVDECVGCMSCVEVCPTGAITVTEA
ncbi:MAG: 4Fe-4S binding protein [Nitrospirae bacterium]|nr:4Fe-4S binding protein [Nitrospirota bacterium]